MGLDYTLAESRPRTGWEKSISFTKRAYLTGSHFPSCRLPRRGRKDGEEWFYYYYTPHPNHDSGGPCARLAPTSSGYILHFLAMFRFNEYHTFNLTTSSVSPYAREFMRKMKEEGNELRFRDGKDVVFWSVPVSGLL